MNNAVTVQIEKMSIPTYPIMECEKMPMFNENRMHQGTKGNPYPVMPVLSVVRENCAPREYEVIRMENDYLRLILIPELGGRVFEAYDKVNHYDFLYRQHVIKPALIGAYGLWISGGLEFNWPFITVHLLICLSIIPSRDKRTALQSPGFPSVIRPTVPVPQSVSCSEAMQLFLRPASMSSTALRFAIAS